MRYEHTDNALYLEHHGIKGQHWGERRFQNEDGSLTAAGRDRYHVGEAREKERKEIADAEYKKLEKSNHAVRLVKKEQDRLAETYGLNKETGKIDPDKAWRMDKQELEAAREAKRKWKTLNDATEGERAKLRAKADERATKKLVEKYGEKSLKDIEYYNQENEKRGKKTAAIVGGIFAAVAGLSLGAILLGHNKSKPKVVDIGRNEGFDKFTNQKFQLDPNRPKAQNAFDKYAGPNWRRYS